MSFNRSLLNKETKKANQGKPLNRDKQIWGNTSMTPVNPFPVPMHQMPDGSWMPGVTHDYYEHGGEHEPPYEGYDPAMHGMMKAKIALANEFGNNPAINRMIVAPDNPYIFPSGEPGSHYMGSDDNYAIPHIQEVDGRLDLTGPRANEAIPFNTPEEADYFARNYKQVAPDPSYREYADGGEFDFEEHGWQYKKVGDQYFARDTRRNTDWMEATGAPLQAIKAKVYREPVAPMDSTMAPDSSYITQMDSTTLDNYEQTVARDSSSVADLQIMLKSAGYDLGNYGDRGDGVDGKMGPQTRAALRAYNNEIPPAKFKPQKEQAEITPQTGLSQQEATPRPKQETALPQPQKVDYNVPKWNVKDSSEMEDGYLPDMSEMLGQPQECKMGEGCSYNTFVKAGSLVNEFIDKSKFGKDYNIWGDNAWFNTSNAVNRGGDVLYQTTERDMAKMPKVSKDLYGKLQIGDYVTLNRRDDKQGGSSAKMKLPHEKKPDEIKSEYAEHLGFIIGKDKDGTPLVWHGSDTGEAVVQRIDSEIFLPKSHAKDEKTGKTYGHGRLDYQIASIVRDPKLKSVDKQQMMLKFDPTDPKKFLSPKEGATITQAEAMKAVNLNTDKLRTLGYSQDDISYIGQLVTGGIMRRESSGAPLYQDSEGFYETLDNFGKHMKRNIKEDVATAYKEVDIPFTGKSLQQHLSDSEDPRRGEASRGIYQIKDEMNFGTQENPTPVGKKLQKLGVNLDNIFDNVENQTLAAMVLNLDNYDYLKQDSDFDRETNLYKGKIPASFIVAKQHNAGAGWYKQKSKQVLLDNMSSLYSTPAMEEASKYVSVGTSNKDVAQEVNDLNYLKQQKKESETASLMNQIGWNITPTTKLDKYIASNPAPIKKKAAPAPMITNNAVPYAPEDSLPFTPPLANITPFFQDGGEYELEDEQIAELKRLGYRIEEV